MLKAMCGILVFSVLSSCGSEREPNSDYLVGNWLTECIHLKAFGTDFSGYFISEIAFSKNNEYSWETEVFNDESCNNSATKLDPKTGTYILGASLLTTEGNIAFELDLNSMSQVDLEIVFVDQGVLFLGESGNNDEFVRPSKLNFDIEYRKVDI